MGYLFILILVVTLILISFPTLFHLILTRVLGFSKAQIKLKHPFKFMGLLVELNNPIWGIETVTIYVPQIWFRIDAKNVKLSIIIDKPRIMLTRNRNELLPIRRVDGIQENKILFNLVAILKSMTKIKNKLPKNMQQDERNQNTKQNRFTLAIQALAQFFILIIIQFMEVQIRSGESAIVSPIISNEFKEQFLKKVRTSIIMLECFAEYLLYIDCLSINANVHKNHQVDISTFCETIKLYTAEHMENNLITGEGLSIKIRIPLSFSFNESLKRVSVYVSLPYLLTNSTPLDFQNLSHILNQFMFKEQFFNGEIISDISDNKEDDQKKIEITIDQADIKMTEIFENDYDTPEALKYLSNISQVLLHFKNIKLNEEGFKVHSAALSLKKYSNQQNDFEVLPRHQQEAYQIQDMEILKINNLLITKEGKTTNISHDAVKISCQKEELALLGKLFILVNSRVIIDEYEEQIYIPFVEVAEEYMNGRYDLTEALRAISARKQYYTSFDQTPTAQSSKQSCLLYSPKQIELHLNISQLAHKITLQGAQYKQSRTISGEINHQLSFPKITLDYKNIKQFVVNDFKLDYNQTQNNNELDMQIGDTLMMQKFDTLKDYLVGFTMFKLLLQFSSDDDEAENGKRAVKSGKKSINFGKIVLNYATELLTLRKLSIVKQSTADGKLSSLYFSLGKCDLSVEKLNQHNRLLKYSLNPSHNLLSITSITLKQFLTLSTSQPSSPKQKFMIHIKSPVILFPQTDISERLINYIKTFNKLQPSIQAFIQNTTDENIKAKRRKYKIFMVDTDLFVIKVTNLLIGMEDSVFDRSMLNKMRFNREYLQRKPKYNESETINYLRQLNKSYNLLEIQVQCISVDIKPLESAGGTERSVKDWTLELKKKYTEFHNEKDDQNVRLIRANNLNVEIELTNLQTKIRDYPFNIASISKIKVCLEYLKTKNIYQQNFHYILAEALIGQVSIQIGLNLLSGISEIAKKLSKYSKAMDEYKNTDEFLRTIKTKKSIEMSKFKPYWHIMHKSMDWYMKAEKQSKIKVRLLTGLTPYSQDSVDLILGEIGLVSNPLATNISIGAIELYGNKLKIFEIEGVGIRLKSQYKEPYLNLDLLFNLSSISKKQQHKKENSGQKETKDQKRQSHLRISEQIIQQMWKIRQMRTDWLLIYGLVEPSSKKQENVLKRQDESNYMNLLKIAADNSLKNRDKELSIFSVLKQVKIGLCFDTFCFELADNENEVNIIINSFNLILVSEINFQKWKMRHFMTTIDSLIGRMKVYKKKSLSHYSSNKEFLTLFSQVTQDQILKNKGYQYFQDIFLVSRGLKLRLNEYAQVGNQILYILKKFEINSLKILLTKQMKRVIDSLVVSIFDKNKQKVEQVSKSKYFKPNALQKFREIVVLVIRSNRKKRKVCSRLKLMFTLKNIQIGFKTPKRLLLLTNGKPSLTTMNTTFNTEDLYHIDPKVSVDYRLNDVEIWVSTEPNHLWVLGTGYSPIAVFQAEKILNCKQINFALQKYENDNLPMSYKHLLSKAQIERYTNLNIQFYEGQIQLTHQNIEVLKEIIEIIISLADSKQQKKKEWMVEKEKYAELIHHGREIVENKIKWNYADLIKGPQPQLQSKIKVSLDRINLILFSNRNKDNQNSSVPNSPTLIPFLKLISSNIQAQIQVYTASTFHKQFTINNLSIINQQEAQDSPYRLMFEMNHIDKLAILMKLQDCLISAMDPRIGWSFNKNLFIHLNPIKIRMTQELYELIYCFFFGSKSEEEKEKEEELSSLIPEFYLSLIIQQCKVQAWFRTSSRLKRLDGVNVGLERFQLSEQFLDKKKLFDKLVMFIVKQLAGQFFNVIGQKLFGNSQ